MSELPFGTFAGRALAILRHAVLNGTLALSER